MANLDATTPQSKVIKGIVDAFATRDLNNLEPILSKDLVFKTFPKVAEHPDLTKAQYLRMYGAMDALFARAELVFHEVIEAPGKAVLHVTFLTTTNDGRTFEYDSLLILTLTDEDGELRVIEAKDFSNPEQRKIFHAEVARLMAKGTPVA